MCNVPHQNRFTVSQEDMSQICLWNKNKANSMYAVCGRYAYYETVSSLHIL